MNLIERLFRKNVIKYSQIGAKSMMEGIKMNGFTINKANDPSAQTQIIQGEEMTEGIDWFAEEKGGIIVFSTDVNAVTLNDGALVNWVLQKIKSIQNRVFVNKKLDKIAKKHEGVFGYTIGNFVKGKYKADNGQIYTEASKAIEIIGINSYTLIQFAEEICKEFKQESVLVKDNTTNKIYFVKP